jgi:peroxiredoxin
VLLGPVEPLAAGAAAVSRTAVAPFDLKDLRGRTVRSNSLRGDVVVVSFWATWCMPCQQELSFLQTYYDRYRDKGLSVLAIATDGPETQSRVRSVARRKRWSIPVLLDKSGTVTSVLNPRGATPYTLFLDRHGRLAHTHEGYASGDELAYESMIKALLAESAPEGA